MHLVSVYEVNADAALYQLLEERPKVANISHQEMPDWHEHKKFIASGPYAHWYAIFKNEHSTEVLGAIYLTRDDEIGIAIFKYQQGHGYGCLAVDALIKKHPRKRYLANIAPGNHRSLEFFSGLGFTHLQETYVLHV